MASRSAAPSRPLAASRPAALLLSPSREAISGVSTHVNLLLPSPLAAEFALVHFQVGSEGRMESRLGRLARFIASPLQLAAAILRLDAAIVHINTSVNARGYWRDLAYLAVAKLCGARVVYQVHGGALPADFFKHAMLRKFLRASLRLPDAIVLLGRAELEAYREFVPGQNCVAMPNGIDCAPYLKHNRPPPNPAAPLRLAYIGRLAREKGLYEALDALRLARFRGVSTRLVIAGSGPEEPRLKERVRELALKNDVAFTGPIEGDAKARLLSQADVLVLPSYSEGLPYALLEAMAAGAVPVATPVGAIPEVMKEGVHGMLVPTRDPQAIARAIGVLAGDRMSLARMSAACRKRIAAAYSIERMAADLSALYAGLLANRSAKAAL